MLSKDLSTDTFLLIPFRKKQKRLFLSSTSFPHKSRTEVNLELSLRPSRKRCKIHERPPRHLLKNLSTNRWDKIKMEQKINDLPTSQNDIDTVISISENTTEKSTNKHTTVQHPDVRLEANLEINKNVHEKGSTILMHRPGHSKQQYCVNSQAKQKFRSDGIAKRHETVIENNDSYHSKKSVPDQPNIILGENIDKSQCKREEIMRQGEKDAEKSRDPVPDATSTLTRNQKYDTTKNVHSKDDTDSKQLANEVIPKIQKQIKPFIPTPRATRASRKRVSASRIKYKTSEETVKDCKMGACRSGQSQYQCALNAKVVETHEKEKEYPLAQLSIPKVSTSSTKPRSSDRNYCRKYARTSSMDSNKFATNTIEICDDYNDLHEENKTKNDFIQHKNETQRTRSRKTIKKAKKHPHHALSHDRSHKSYHNNVPVSLVDDSEMKEHLPYLFYPEHSDSKSKFSLDLSMRKKLIRSGQKNKPQEKIDEESRSQCTRKSRDSNDKKAINRSEQNGDQCSRNNEKRHLKTMNERINRNSPSCHQIPCRLTNKHLSEEEGGKDYSKPELDERIADSRGESSICQQTKSSHGNSIYSDSTSFFHDEQPVSKANQKNVKKDDNITKDCNEEHSRSHILDGKKYFKSSPTNVGSEKCTMETNPDESLKISTNIGDRKNKLSGEQESERQEFNVTEIREHVHKARSIELQEEKEENTCQKLQDKPNPNQETQNLDQMPTDQTTVKLHNKETAKSTVGEGNKSCESDKNGTSSQNLKCKQFVVYKSKQPSTFRNLKNIKARKRNETSRGYSENRKQIFVPSDFKHKKPSTKLKPNFFSSAMNSSMAIISKARDNSRRITPMKRSYLPSSKRKEKGCFSVLNSISEDKALAVAKWLQCLGQSFPSAYSTCSSEAPTTQMKSVKTCVPIGMKVGDAAITTQSQSKRIQKNSPAIFKSLLSMSHQNTNSFCSSQSEAEDANTEYIPASLKSSDMIRKSAHKILKKNDTKKARVRFWRSSIYFTFLLCLLACLTSTQVFVFWESFKNH